MREVTPFFFKKKVGCGDPAETEDRTGDRYASTAIDCLVLYHIGVQEAIKTLCRRES